MGSTAVADEPVGRGRSIVFSFDPLYGGGSEGTQKVLFNAILGPDPKGFGRAEPVRYDAEEDRAAVGRHHQLGGRTAAGRALSQELSPFRSR